MFRRIRLALSLFFVVGAISAQASEPSTTPLGSPDFQPTPERPFGWRGDGSGRFPAATPPLEWSLTKNVRWNTVVGRSYSSPILAAKGVIVTAEPNLLLCLDRTDGKVLWKVESKPADITEEKYRKLATDYEVDPAGSGMTAATPVTDGKNIYVVFANGIVRAVDLDGKVQWTAFIDAEQITGYGRSASPIIVGGKLIVHMTGLYAFDLATGKQLWMNAEAKSRYGSPTELKSGALNLIVTPAGDVVRADDGKTVSTSIGGSYNSTPVVADGVIYFGEKDVTATRLNAAFKAEDIWSSSIDDDVFGSPVLHAGVLFNTNSKAALIAFNASAKGSSEPIIATRNLLPEGTGEEGKPVAFSSLTLAGKNLFLNTTLGQTIILEASRDAKIIGRNSLHDGTGSSPIFSGKEIYLRDGNKLYCISE